LIFRQTRLLVSRQAAGFNVSISTFENEDLIKQLNKAREMSRTATEKGDRVAVIGNQESDILGHSTYLGAPTHAS